MLRYVSWIWALLLAHAVAIAPQLLCAQNASHSELSQLVASPLPSGATAQGASSFYGPDNLYQYMDGGADMFVLYGVRTLLHQDAKTGTVEVTADVFDMGTPDAAFGIYA